MKCSKYQKPTLHGTKDKENAPEPESASAIPPATPVRSTSNAHVVQFSTPVGTPNTYGAFFDMLFATPTYQRRVWVRPDSTSGM